MGQANRAPKPFYGRKFQISSHAIERFRERVDEEHFARPDHDLMNLLDERIQSASRKQDVIDHSYKGTLSTIYFVESRKGQGSLAVVRDNTCVTLLDEDMLEVNCAKKTWSMPMNTPFKDALAGVSAPRRLTPKPEAVAQAVAAGRIVAPPSPTVDPVAVAGAAHGRAMLAEAAASVRVLAAERELDEARVALETARDDKAKAEHALREAVNTAANINKEIK
jgi:hypothetical protein